MICIENEKNLLTGRHLFKYSLGLHIWLHNFNGPPKDEDSILDHGIRTLSPIQLCAIPDFLTQSMCYPHYHSSTYEEFSQDSEITPSCFSLSTKQFSYNQLYYLHSFSCLLSVGHTGKISAVCSCYQIIASITLTLIPPPVLTGI